jgi:hypothetical protein
LLNIDGVVQGEARSYPSYTIKKKKFRLSKRNGIASFMEKLANTQLNTPAAKANLLFQNKRKCNFSSYDTNQTIWIGYNLF